MWKRFDANLRRVVTAALRDAASRGRDEAGPEHLIAALTELPADGVACDDLLAKVLDKVQPRLADPKKSCADRLNVSAMRLLETAVARAGDRGKITLRHVAPLLGQALPQDVRSALARVRPEFKGGGIPTDLSPPSFARRGAEAIAHSAAGRVVRRVFRAPRVAWNIYVRHGLGHPAYVDDPYPLYRKLREREPVRRDPTAPVWVVTSHEHTLTTLRDPRFNKDPFVAERLPRGAREQLGMSEAAGARSSAENISMLFLDPPDHTRVRSIFTRAFTPRTLESLRPRIREICDEQLATMAGQSGPTDLISTLAYPLPVMVIAELLGFPRQDYQRLKQWSDDMAEALGFVPSEDAKVRAGRARDEMRTYFFSQIVPRLRRESDQSLLSRLLELEARGEGLNEDELFSNSVLLLAAGHETTTGLIGNGVLALLRHPDQLELLRSDPTLIGPAMEEILRYDPPVQWTTRVAAQDIELGGKLIKRGELVLSALGGANRDPAVFSNPDRLDIRRTDNKHLSFGSGIHFCLGASLARMEAEIAIGTLITRFPNLKLATDKLRWRKGITFRGLHELPLHLT